MNNAPSSAPARCAGTDVSTKILFIKANVKPVGRIQGLMYNNPWLECHGIQGTAHRGCVLDYICPKSTDAFAKIFSLVSSILICITSRVTLK